MGEDITHDRLCKIHEEYSQEPTTSEVAVKISERVGREIPEIYQDYAVVLTNGNDVRYEMFKQLARETAQQPEWQCEAIRKRSAPPGG